MALCFENKAHFSRNKAPLMLSAGSALPGMNKQLSSSQGPSTVRKHSGPPFDSGREGGCWGTRGSLGCSGSPELSCIPQARVSRPPQPRLVPRCREGLPHSCSWLRLLGRVGCVPEPVPRLAVCKSQVLAPSRLGHSLPGRAAGCSAALPCQWLRLWGVGGSWLRTDPEQAPEHLCGMISPPSPFLTLHLEEGWTGGTSWVSTNQETVVCFIPPPTSML